jgi:OPA family glycerol-3-phosphate transporter-like MFS transporter
MIGFLKPAALRAPLAADRIDAEYRRLRRRVFAGIFVGYAGYYLVRNNLALAIPDLLAEHPEHSKAELGTALTALSITYGVSKFLMGSVSDRSNPKYFLPLGLLLSSMIMATFGLVDALYASLAAIIAIMAVNGWVQGMGWPPCGKLMVHWFSTRERGLVVSTWNTAHNVGGALVASLALAGVTLFHDWGAKFYFNALVAAIVAIGVYFLLEDTPQSRGLPAVEQYRNDYPPGYSERHERTLTFREIFLEYVLPNRYLWAIAVANAFCYFVRYGVVNWIPTYLETAKGFSFQQSSIAWSLYEWAAIPGTIACGWLSDRWFEGRRAPMTMLFMALTLLAVGVYWLNMHGPLWIDYAALIAIGFLVYGPIMMIGLHSLDLVPKKAAGTAAGFTGFFGYVFGSAIAGTGVGWIADRWDWGGVFTTMVACCLLTIFFVSLTLGHKAQSAGLPEPRKP